MHNKKNLITKLTNNNNIFIKFIKTLSKIN